MSKVMVYFEALKIIYSLGVLESPNTPSGSQYMAKISDEFAMNASSDDRTLLLKIVSKSVKGVYFTTIDGMRGYFAFTKEKFSLKKLENNTTKLLLIHQSGDYALLARTGVQGDPSPFIPVWRLNTRRSGNSTLCDWQQGYYMPDLNSAINLYVSKIL